MIEIPLTRGLVALIDDEDLDLVCWHNWHAWINKRSRSFYACTNLGHGTGNQYKVQLHRFIMGFPDVGIDHKNGNGLDCQKENLRLATHVENCRNKGKQANNTSGFKGVCRYVYWGQKKVTVRWLAYIEFGGRQKRKGGFRTAIAAALAYDTWAIEIFGEFARLNFPKSGIVAEGYNILPAQEN
jgi:hypothetical protein